MANEREYLLPLGGIFVIIEMECPLCNKYWKAKCQMFTPKLECPECGYVVSVEEHEVLE